MSPTSDIDDLGGLFWLSLEKFRAIEHGTLRNSNLLQLTPADIRTIYRIGQSRRERMTNLARNLRLTVGTLTVTIDRLVEKGFVVRQRIEEDRRVVEVHLSQKGAEVFEEIVRVRRLIVEKLLHKLDEEERQFLAKILLKLLS
jgi:DNA-binding MarR family transcriptional regulator